MTQRGGTETHQNMDKGGNYLLKINQGMNDVPEENVENYSSGYDYNEYQLKIRSVLQTRPSCLTLIKTKNSRYSTQF